MRWYTAGGRGEDVNMTAMNPNGSLRPKSVTAITHVVLHGESLTAAAQRFGCNVTSLRRSWRSPAGVALRQELQRQIVEECVRARVAVTTAAVMFDFKQQTKRRTRRRRAA